MEESVGRQDDGQMDKYIGKYPDDASCVSEPQKDLTAREYVQAPAHLAVPRA